MGAQSASQGQAASAAGAVLNRDMPRESAICVLPISAMDMANATRQDRVKAPACQLAVPDAGVQKRIITCAQNEFPEGMDVTEEGWSMRNQAGSQQESKTVIEQTEPVGTNQDHTDDGRAMIQPRPLKLPEPI